MAEKPNDEAMKRTDDTLLRMLKTPPKPHKESRKPVDGKKQKKNKPGESR